MKKIYLASPFANKTQRKYIYLVLDKLRNSGYKVYAPCEMKIKKANKENLLEWEKSIFIRDIKEISESDIVLGLNYDSENAVGASWELEQALVDRKQVYIVYRDNAIDNIASDNRISGYISINDILNSDKLELERILENTESPLL